MRTARLYRGWSQAELATAAGLTRDAVTAVESNPTRRVRLNEAAAIAAALNTTVEVLMTDGPIIITITL